MSNEMNFDESHAFPMFAPHDTPWGIGLGLTKRELFAALAMQGMIAGSSGISITNAEFAKASVALADTLMAELKKNSSCPST